MYAQHQPKIAQFAQESPENFARVGIFVLSTINMHFEQVPSIMRGYDADGVDFKRFSGNTRKAINAFIEESPRLHKLLVNGISEQDLIMELVQLPGLRIVKASFIVQLVMTGASVGCLDRWHLRTEKAKALGLDERSFINLPKTPAYLRQRIAAYVAICGAMGGAEQLWDEWCFALAGKRPKSLRNAEYVSAMHIQCLLGEDVD